MYCDNESYWRFSLECSYVIPWPFVVIPSLGPGLKYIPGEDLCLHWCQTEYTCYWLLTWQNSPYFLLNIPQQSAIQIPPAFQLNSSFSEAVLCSRSMSIFVPSFIFHIHGISTILYWYVLKPADRRKAMLIQEYLTLKENPHDDSKNKVSCYYSSPYRRGDILKG